MSDAYALVDRIFRHVGRIEEVTSDLYTHALQLTWECPRADRFRAECLAVKSRVAGAAQGIIAHARGLAEAIEASETRHAGVL